MPIFCEEYEYEAPHHTTVSTLLLLPAPELQDQTNRLFTVFASAADRDWVINDLQPQLEEGPEKYHLCLHERDFVLGSIIANNIVDCMRNSRITLVILSPQFVRSQVSAHRD
jgi:hypothetical protein